MPMQCDKSGAARGDFEADKNLDPFFWWKQNSDTEIHKRNKFEKNGLMFLFHDGVKRVLSRVIFGHVCMESVSAVLQWTGTFHSY